MKTGNVKSINWGLLQELYKSGWAKNRLRNKSIACMFILFFVFASFQAIPASKDYPITPIPFNKVTVSDDFWAKRIKTNHDVTIPIAIKKSIETGRVKNFAIAGGLEKGDFCSPYPFDDSDVYKIIEGAAYSLAMFPDKKLEAIIDSLINLIELAQEDDGYLYTNRTIMGSRAHEWAGKERWVKDDDLSHELYNLGHFYEAATAYYQTTGKKKILDVAIKSANLVNDVFGYGKLMTWPGHQEIEIGLVKLYRITGDKKYLDLAKFFLDIRGAKNTIATPKTYNQSHIPVTEQSEAVGHSVRGAYMWSGMADVAAMTGDKKYAGAITRIWEDVVYRKLYITGGIGAEGGLEGFGGPYELPNMKAYCETCAAIANVYWNYRMFLMTGEAKYIDVLERSLYNNVLSGVSLDGSHFFYPNPLESVGQHQRSEWFGCACCPSNISRFIPSMPNYIYAQKTSFLYVNLFATSSTTFTLTGGELALFQQSQMPWNGKVNFTFKTAKPRKATLNIRVPGWATDFPVPGDLYQFTEKTKARIVFKVNGKTVTPGIEKGYAVFTSTWKNGDRIEVEFPFEVRKITANEKIEDDRDKVALQLGPLVYCAEFADFENPEILNLVLEKNVPLSVEYKPGLLGGVNIITGEAKGTRKINEQGDTETWPRKFTAIPYYAWSHRGKGQMAVWIPATIAASTPTPYPSVASKSAIEASLITDGLKGINDQVLPKNSADKENLFYHWWPRKNETHWVIYRFNKVETLSESSVYWLKDTPGGECNLPESWKLYYDLNGKWIPVETIGNYPIEADKLNKIEFKPVKTASLKLEVKLQKEFSAGIHEWSVKPN